MLKKGLKRLAKTLLQKIQKIFLNTTQKIPPENSFPLPINRQKPK